jgi:hypothetical protein
MAEERNYLHISGQSVTLPIWVFGGITACMFSLLMYNFKGFTNRLDTIQASQSEIQKGQQEIREDILELKYQYQSLELRVFDLERENKSYPYERNTNTPPKKKPIVLEKSPVVFRKYHNYLWSLAGTREYLRYSSDK